MNPKDAPRSYQAIVKDTASLTEEEFNVLSIIYKNSYQGADLSHFREKILKKNKIVLMRNRQRDRIVGFSTFHSIERRVLGKKHIEFSSGNTALREGVWGYNFLQRAMSIELLKIKLKNPLTDVYLLMTSLSFKSYLMLVNNIRSTYPRYDRETPLHEQTILDAFLENVPANTVILHDGVKLLRSLSPTVAPLEHAANIGELEIKNAHIRYYAQKNPGSSRGDRLGCISKIDFFSMLSFALKFMKKKLSPAKKRTAQIIPLRANSTKSKEVKEAA